VVGAIEDRLVGHVGADDQVELIGRGWQPVLACIGVARLVVADVESYYSGAGK
jgi:hypothetical protein